MTLLLNFAIGLLFLILIVVTILAITICNRMRKQNKSLTRYIAHTLYFLIDQVLSFIKAR